MVSGRAVMVSGIVLAAGSGSRMGTPKANLELGGQTLLDRTLSMLFDGGCTTLIAVLGATQPPHCGDAVTTFVHNPDWESGMASSLRAGLAEATGEAAVVALVDQPGITSEAVTRLIDSHRPGFASVATFKGEMRTPVLFDRALWGEVAASVTGDAGARYWLRRNLPRVIPVACDDVADPSDLDLPIDLTGWEKS
jgi:CTP:molybdopterin cytidylyltransferase MocA